MTQSLDRRTRFDADVRWVTPHEFFGADVQELLGRNGALVAEGARALGARPLAVEIEGEAWTFQVRGGSAVVVEGVSEDAFVAVLTKEQFSDLVQQEITFNGFVVAREMRCRNGTEWDLSVWDSLWLAMLEGWPVVDEELQFLDRGGEPLDLSSSFTPESDPADIAHFLREAGFLSLKGWLDPRDLAIVSDDIDRAVPEYVEGDGRSWWALDADGTPHCVRIQDFLGYSPTTKAILESERWDQLIESVAGDDALVRTPVEGRCIEALIKPPGIVSGPSEVTFHRDCHFGRHAYGCSGMVVGVAVTPGDEERGLLRVVAGSHRLAMPIEVAKVSPYLPVISVPTEPGDLTVHLTCTLHESTPPKDSTRKVMYGGGFKLAPREGEQVSQARSRHSAIRESVYKVLLEESDGSPRLDVG